MLAQYSRIFHWHVLRYLARHPLLASLNVAAVALGVALYLAVQIANGSANRAFAATVDVVAGKAQLEVSAPNDDLPDRLLPRIASVPGVAAATPIVRGFVTLPDFPGEYLDLLGIDIFTNQPFRTFQITDLQTDSFDLQRWLRGPDTVALSAEFARQHRLRIGEKIRVQSNGTTRRLTIAFLIHGQERDAEPDLHFAAMDIGWAQEFLHRAGSLDSISVRLTNAAQTATVAAALRKISPVDATVAAPARRSEEVQKMLAGFQLNLTAMSLVALAVAMFLIENTVEASVVRRRPEIGILRSLGASRAEIRALFLGEALVLGLAGVFAGLVGGYFLAHALVGAVTETISSLYVLVSVQHLRTAPWVWWSAILLGLISVLFAAWLPARAAAAVDPIAALHHGTKLEKASRPARRWLAGSLFSLGSAAALSFLALHTGPAWLGFGAALCVLIGFSLATPHTIFSFSRMLRRPLRRRIEPALAAQNLGRSLLRNAITVAALAAALAMTVGVAVMVFSFRETVSSWIAQTLVADLYIGPAANEIVGPTSFMPPESIRFLEQNPAVATIDTFRQVDVPFRDQTISLAVVRGSDRRNFHFLEGRGEQIMPRFYDEQTVLISESFARRFRLTNRDSLLLPTPSGVISFAIAGVFYNYSSDQGVVFLSARNFQKFWRDDRVNSVAVYLHPAVSPEKIADEFRQQFSRLGEFSLYSNRSLRRRIFEIFDQTFAVTYVLRTIALVVAVIGVFLGLTTLIAERSRELAILRAIGASAAQVRRLLLWESGMVGLLASVVGMASGLCLACVLTGVINRAFFGWTIQLVFPWRELAWTPFWITGVAVVAGCLPAWRAGKTELAAALRSE